MIVEYRDGNGNKGCISDCNHVYFSYQSDAIYIERSCGERIRIKIENREKLERTYDEIVKSAENWVRLAAKG